MEELAKKEMERLEALAAKMRDLADTRTAALEAAYAEFDMGMSALQEENAAAVAAYAAAIAAARAKEDADNNGKGGGVTKSVVSKARA